VTGNAKKTTAKPSRKRKQRCSNCGLAHDGPCIEPNYPEASKKKKRGKKTDKDNDSDLEEMYECLFGNSNN